MKLLRVALQSPGKFCNSLAKDDAFPVIWDSGASVSITSNRGDFIEYNPKPGINRLNGIGSGLQVLGSGTVAWNFVDEKGNLRELKVIAYHFPDAKVRLISTQGFLAQYPREGVTIDSQTLRISGDPHNSSKQSISVHINPTSKLPISYGYNTRGLPRSVQCLNAVRLDDRLVDIKVNKQRHLALRLLRTV